MSEKGKARKTWIYAALIVVIFIVLGILSVSMSSFSAGGGKSHYGHGIPVLGLIFETDCEGSICSHSGVLFGFLGTVLAFFVMALAVWKIIDLLQPQKKG